MRYFISVFCRYECTKERCNFFIRETTRFRCSCINGWNFQRMYYPINNQQLFTRIFRRTGWRDKLFPRTVWRKELVKKWFRRTGWSNKWFRQTGWCNKLFRKLVVIGNDPKSDPSSDPKVATHTNNGNFTQELLISRFCPKYHPSYHWTD